MAARLSFTASPTAAVQDSVVGTVRVAVLDTRGDVVPSSTAVITVSLGTNPGGASLAGTTTATAVSGVATFDDLSLSALGSGYTLVAAAAGLTPDTSAAFDVTLSLADLDGDGYSPHTGDCAEGVADIHPSAQDLPDASYTDTNCDGIDGDEASAIFVATSGTDDAACGTKAAPCASVQVAIDRATASGKRDVYVAAGTYPGSVTLASGVSLYGGYAADWQRGPANVATLEGDEATIVGGAPRALTLFATQLDQPVVVADLTMVGPNATGHSGGNGASAYVVVAVDVAADLLTLTRNVLVAGDGAPGLHGLDGADADTVDATAAMAGGDGGPGNQYVTLCDAASRGAAGPAGIGRPGAGGGAGGRGGPMDSSCGIPPVPDPRPGEDGESAETFAVDSYGYRGVGGIGEFTGCSLTPGSPGNDGRVLNGAGGSGGASGGQLVDLFWHGRPGGAGELGEDGTGGGGGGGSGACDQQTDAYGAGGGGGGAGGARAKGAGTGGGGGGGSIAVYLVDASPTLSDNLITRGKGGAGGSGGIGGRGQSGGPGGAGGIGDGTGDGGRGGDGGHGGHGGGGGGGAGGISAGIYSYGGAPVLTGNTISGGSGGAGGRGGASAPGAPPEEADGNPGDDGADGDSIDVGTCAAPGAC